MGDVEELREKISRLEAELSALRSTRMNCVRDGKCQHCGVEAPYCYHPTVEEYSKATRRVAELEAALREIMEHPHCEWGGNYNVFPCDDRDVIGHRCAAEIARKVLDSGTQKD